MAISYSPLGQALLGTVPDECIIRRQLALKLGCSFRLQSHSTAPAITSEAK